MADRYYATLGRDGLASSYSYLDGVPFKIGPSFKQQAKIDVPPEYARVTTQRVLNFEYSYETEEGVLAWARAREEAARQAARQEEERAQQEAELTRQEEAARHELTRQAEAARHQFEAQTDSANTQEVPQVLEESNSQDVSLPSTSDAQTSQPVIRPKPPVPRRPPPPRPSSQAAGMILTPVQAGAKPECIEGSAEAKASCSNVDVSMFEQEADPFDNLELQTLNDMEELKIVLDTRPTPAPRKTLSQPENIPEKNNDCGAENIYDVAKAVKQDNWVTFEDENGVTVQDEQNSDMSDIQCAGDHTVNAGDKKLLQFPPDLSTSVATSCPPTTDNIQSSFGGKLPVNLASSKLYKPVLPPIPGPEQNGNCDAINYSSGLNGLQASNPYLSQPTLPTNPFMPKDNTETPLNSGISDNFTSNPFTTSNPQTFLANRGLGRPLPTPPPIAAKPSLATDSSNSRMWSSMGPSAFVGSMDDVRPSPQPRNAYSRHSASTTDLLAGDSDTCRKSFALEPVSSTSPPSGQVLNQFRPLPPTPSSKPASCGPPVGLSDPYPSLTREEQLFTDSLASMGFLRARVARAVKNFGQDEREVLDHLLAVDKLVEKKYMPVLVETALRIFKNDMEKSEKYLTMLCQFEGLGFQRDLVQDALVTTDMDHDKTLDLLTA